MELKDYGFKMAALWVAAQVSEPLNQSMHSGFYYAHSILSTKLRLEFSL